MRSQILAVAAIIGFAVITTCTVSSAQANAGVDLDSDRVRFFRVVGPVPVTITDVTPEGWITWTNVATNTTFTIQTAQELGDESGWVDYVQVPSTNSVTVHHTFDPNPPEGFVLIPGGNFIMGNLKDESEGWPDELPPHTVYVSAFYMERTEVTNDQMVEVMQWAWENNKISANSYTVRNLEGNSQELLDMSFSSCRITWDGSQFGMKSAKGSGYPCVQVTWYGAVAFCNYRSEMEGLTPCYDLSDWSCDWSANGYRLPTEAEWEKAARGGYSGQRFPWGDTIDHNRANYVAYGSLYSYDTSPYTDWTSHPDYDDGDTPYTSPVGSFPAAGSYGAGLYDMVGNVWEWCWDWYFVWYYETRAATEPNPRGPPSGLFSVFRVVRGGGWSYGARYCRVASRSWDLPDYSFSYRGFRCVRPAGQ